MAEHSDDGKKILSELKDKGIADLDTLVRKITENKAAAVAARRIICDRNHWCVVVPK